jgi:uncharacterized membrane protein
MSSGPRERQPSAAQAWAALLLVAAAALAAGLPVEASTVVGPKWSGPTDTDAGWHMRVPITVHNPFGAAMVDAPVAAEVDLGQALIDGGWTSFDAGGHPQLSGFQLDLASARLVRVSNLKPFTGAGSSDGRDLGEVPSIVMPGLLGRSTPAAALARPYNPASNPAVTVFFRVPVALDPGKDAFFELYFENALRQGAPLPAASAGGLAAVESLHWSTAGTHLMGPVTAPSGTPNRVTVVALYPGTKVTVSRLTQGRFSTEGVTLDGGNPATLDAGQAAVAGLGPGASPIVRIDASAPVVAAVDPVGFVPSADAGLLGGEFRFKTGSASGAARGVYLINPGQDTARVRVTGGGGPSVPYDIPAGGYGGSSLCLSGGAWAELRESTAYEVKVESGGPILVQLQPRQAQQVPAVDGAPTGTRFVAAAQWSDPGNCGLGLGQPARAQGLGEGALLNAFSLEDDIDIYPPGSSGNQHPVPPALPREPTLSDPIGLQPASTRARDRPIAFGATSPVRLFAGGLAKSGSGYAVAGPLGGSGAGREFGLPGPTLVLAPYPQTNVTATAVYAGGTATVQQLLGRNGTWSLGDDPALGRLLSAHLSADRPVLAYPTGVPAGFLAGIPGFLDASSGAAQYRGRLIELRSATGEDPFTASVKAGEASSFTFTVANHGRGVDGSAGPQESVLLDVRGVPDGWDVHFDRKSLPLGPDQQDTVHLVVKPPSGGGAGAPPTALTAVAASAADPAASDELGLVFSIRSSYGVGLWFLEPVLGPKSITATIPPGGDVDYPVFAKNTGSQPDTFVLTVDSPDGSKSANVTDLEGEAIDGVTLQPGEVRELRLAVVAGELQDGLRLTRLTAQSQTAASAIDRVTALTRVRVASDLNLTVQQPFQRLADGEEALFRLDIENQAAGSSDVQFQVLSDAPADWRAPSLFVLDPATQKRIPVQRLTVDGQSTQAIYVNLTAPAGSAAGRLVALRVVAVPDGGAGIDAPLSGIVAPRHATTGLFDADPLPVVPGLLVNATLVLRNGGNLNESILLSAASLPAGWSLALPNETVEVPRGGQANVTVGVTAGNAAPAGLYPAALALRFADGAVRALGLNFTVPSSLGTAGGAGQALEVQPGRPADIAVPYTNTGNQPVLVRLLPASGETWAFTAGAPVPVAPGASAVLSGQWAVPREQPDGRVVHRLSVEAASPAGGSKVQAARAFTLDVGRSDLVIENGTAFSTAAGGLARAAVGNTGNRPAFDVEVAVFAGDGKEAVATQRIARILPGATAEVLVPVPETAKGALSLQVDPQDAIVETTDGNNGLALTAAAGHGAPGPGPALLLALVVGAALARRGRRPGP